MRGFLDTGLRRYDELRYTPSIELACQAEGVR